MDTVCPVLISKAATVLPNERLRETFDVLLSTPISMREIVRQKFAGVQRLIWVLSVPLLTVVAAHASFMQTSNTSWNDARSWVWYTVGMCGLIGIYPRMIAWMSVLIGLKVKSQAKAIFITLAILLSWIVAPVVCMIILEEFGNVRIDGDNPIVMLLACQSPAMPIFFWSQPLSPKRWAW